MELQFRWMAIAVQLLEIFADCQVVLALVFLTAGFMKISRPKEALAEQMAWVEDFGQGVIRLIGAYEIVAALALLLPVLIGVLPWLAPVAGAALALDLIAAAFVHARWNEFQMIPINVILLVLAVLVAYGLFVIAPLA